MIEGLGVIGIVLLYHLIKFAVKNGINESALGQYILKKDIDKDNKEA